LLFLFIEVATSKSDTLKSTTSSSAASSREVCQLRIQWRIYICNVWI